ncbi:Ribonuclease/ribotoxin [Annulohypoxylon moriforme]|nr:Ribonuclease/ribotoxin [Annulohypoxylon moriforme]
MIASDFLSFLALASTAVLASPIRNETELVERQLRNWNCGGTQYTTAQVQAAWNNAIHLTVTGGTIQRGSSEYPHEFRNGQAGNPEVDPSPCAGLTLREFPILASGALYTGGDPKTDRVVYGSSDPNNGVWEECFLMTHTGARARNLFVKCT